MSESSKFLNTTEAYLTGSRKSKLESVSRKGDASDVTSSKSFGLTSQISARYLRVTSIDSSRPINDLSSHSGNEATSSKQQRKASVGSSRHLNEGSDSRSTISARPPTLGEKTFHAESISRKSKLESMSRKGQLSPLAGNDVPSQMGSDGISSKLSNPPTLGEKTLLALNLSSKSKLESVSRKAERRNLMGSVDTPSEADSEGNTSSLLHSPPLKDGNFVALKVSRRSQLESVSRKGVGSSPLISGSEDASSYAIDAVAVTSGRLDEGDEYEDEEDSRSRQALVQVPPANVSLRPGASNSTRGQNQIPLSLVRVMEKEHRQKQAAREAAANGTATTMGTLMTELNPFTSYFDTIHSFNVLNESPFTTWTKDEMILVIVYEGYHIYDEPEVSHVSLQEFMDELFPVEEGVPVKRGYTEEEWFIIERGVARLQAIWIDYKYMVREKFKYDPSYQGFDPVNLRTYDFDFSREILDWEQLDEDELSETDVSPASLRMTPARDARRKSQEAHAALEGENTPGGRAGTDDADLRRTPTRRLGDLRASKRKSLRQTPGPGGRDISGANQDSGRDSAASEASSPTTGAAVLRASPRGADLRTSQRRDLSNSPSPTESGHILIPPQSPERTPGEEAVFGASPHRVVSPAPQGAIRRRSSIRRHKHRNSSTLRQMEDAQKIRQILDTPWVRPDHDAAYRSLDFMHPRKGGKGGEQFELFDATTGRYCMLGLLGEQCDLWEEGQISEFSVFGPGVTNYFKFIKFMLWILMSMFVITIPVLIINTFGDNISQGLLSLADTTVGNLQNLSNNSTYISTPFVSLAGQYVTFQRQNVAIFYMATDIIIVILVLCAFFWLKAYEVHEDKIVNKTAVYPSQFTIEVNNLPEERNEIFLRAQLKEFFKNVLKGKFEIVDIDFAYNNETEIRACRERGQLIKLKIALVNKFRYNATIVRNGVEVAFHNREPTVAKLRTQFYTDMKVIDARIKMYDDALLRLESIKGKQEGDIPKVVYIVFNDAVGAATAVKMFQPTVFDLFSQDSGMYFKGKRLEVKVAPEPNTIIWETVITPFWTRVKRQCLTTAVALSFVLISFFITFSALVTMQNYTQQNQQCPLGFFQLSVPQQQALVSQYSNDLHCYCDQFSPSSQATNPYCKTYATKATQVQVMMFFAAVIVLLVNSFMEYVFDFFADFEKHRTEVDKERSIFFRLFILKYLNTACLFLLVSDQNFVQQAVNATYPTTVDMTLGWYQSVGVIIMLTVILNIGFMQIPNMIHYGAYLYRIYREKEASVPTAFTQVDLNKLYVGPQMPFAYRYAQIVSLFFVILTFNTGMPILNLVGSINFLVFYFVEKYLFINFYRTPFRFSAEISKIATMLVPVAVAIHLAMSIWTLSNQNIFSSNPNSFAPSTPSNVTSSQKISYPQTKPLFIMFCIVVVTMFVYMVAKEVEVRYFQITAWMTGEDRDFFLGARKSISQAIGFAAFVNGGFLRAVQRNLIKELASYSILKNPKYKELFGISWEFAAKNKRVSAIRKSITKLVSNFDVNADDLSDAMEDENMSVQEVMRQRRLSIDEVTPFDSVNNPYETDVGLSSSPSPLRKLRQSPAPQRRFSGIRDAIRKQFSGSGSDAVNPYAVPSPSADPLSFDLAYPSPSESEPPPAPEPESTITKVIRRFSLTNRNSIDQSERHSGEGTPASNTGMYSPVSPNGGGARRRGSAPAGVNSDTATHPATSPRIIAMNSPQSIRSASDKPLRNSRNLDSYVSSTMSPESLLQPRSPIPAPRRHSGVETDYDRNRKQRQSGERPVDLSAVRIETLSNPHNRLDVQSNPHVNQLRNSANNRVLTAPSMRSSGPLRSPNTSAGPARDSYSSTGALPVPSSRDKQTGERYDNIWSCYADTTGKTYWRNITNGDVCFYHPSQLEAESGTVDL